MKRKKYPIVNFEYDDHLTTCIMEMPEENIFIGQAQCNEQDYDFENKMTGSHIAMARAQIGAYQHIKNTQIRPVLSYLKSTYANMSQSSKFDENSYEAKYLRREIKKLEEDFIEIKSEIENTQLGLKQFINDKDELYKKVRANRAKNK